MELSLAMIAEPRKRNGIVEKGVIVANQCDRLSKIVPHLKDYFYLVERRGWLWMNSEKTADVKLVDDLTTLEETKRKFPEAIVLEFSNGDFVDTDLFHPLNIPKIYTGIQIAAWPAFKRHELFVRAAALLPQERFIKFGHFWQKSRWFDRNSEAVRRRKIIRLAHRLHASIDFPGEADASEVNRLVNTAKMGILTSEHEGLSRFKMECLSADIPVLVPEDAGPATTRHINEKTGMLFKPTPEDLAEAIRYVEDHLGSFSPRAYVLGHTGVHHALPALKNALRMLAKRDGFQRDYEEISWNGRNEGLIWGRGKAIAEVKNAVVRCNP
ncbi:glycosyltransferase [Patescibacteria group bacterium]|nr:glycosyltransferase [Patescibacteria group bacterium]MCL5114899.1 glycosyltransferase [Patescibacteria group bacterium]